MKLSAISSDQHGRIESSASTLLTALGPVASSGSSRELSHDRSSWHLLLPGYSSGPGLGPRTFLPIGPPSVTVEG